MNVLTDFKKDFSWSAFVAGLIVVLVGMTSSAVIVFQAAKAFGATTQGASSWLGSVCLGMGFLTIYFSWRFRSPVLIAWSTPGAVLLVAGAPGISLPEAIGAFVFSSALVFVFGVTGWFERIMNRIPVSLTAALLAGVLLHFCLEAFSSFPLSPLLVGSLFLTYVVGRKINPRMTMMLVLFVGVVISTFSGTLQFHQIEWAQTSFEFTRPLFTWASLVGLGLPLFVVTMASQNLTGLSVMRTYQYNHPISSMLTGMGAVNFVVAFFGGFTLNLAAITAAIAMGPEAHPDKSKRYVAALVSGVIYLLIGLFAGSISSVFAAFPKELVLSIAGFALLGTVATGLETSLMNVEEKEAAFVTFVIAASGFQFLGISSAFWAILVGLALHVANLWSSRKDLTPL